jgi:hypothetical protein
VRLLPSKDDRLVFQFSATERDLFLAAVSFYPLLNPDYHRLTKNATADPKLAAEEKVLRDAMEEQRRENKKLLAEFIDSIDWKKSKEDKFRISLTPEQVDWLLRILNDVRVGAWDIIGRPNQQERSQIDLQSKNSHYYGVMELSGSFQSAFLHALEKGSEGS